MLAAVLTMFLVFSFSGVAVLNLSTFTSMENQNSVQNLKNQYEVESSVNRSLWAINAGVDSLVNLEGLTTVAYDSLSKELLVSIDRYDKTFEVSVDLADQDHFENSLSASDTIEHNSYTVYANEGEREFGFLPNTDLDYFMDNATEIHTESFHKFVNGDVSGDGIHVFTGSYIDIENVVINGTLVFTGRYISFDKHLTVVADTTAGLPAMVFSNDLVEVSFYESNGDDDINVNGPVFSAGKIWMRDGSFTGPIVGKEITLEADMTFDTSNKDKHNNWKNGFGARDSYDWPKQIGRWKVQYGDEA